MQPQTPLRAAITAAYRRPEPDCLPSLLADADQPPAAMQQVRSVAETLVRALRAKGSRGLVETLLQEYALSSQEGVALMCLAEALLRIPDAATRDALIRDKIGQRQLAGASRPAAIRCSSTRPPGGCCSPAGWPRPRASRACRRRSAG